LVIESLFKSFLRKVVDTIVLSNQIESVGKYRSLFETLQQFFLNGLVNTCCDQRLLLSPSLPLFDLESVREKIKIEERNELGVNSLFG
jgi:hypothetical protein